MLKLVQVTISSALALFLYGCGSAGVHVVTYGQDRPRVDQEISGMDNAGYVGGTMKSSTIYERKKTRRVYVMEISKGAGNIKPIGDEEISAAGASADQGADASAAGGSKTEHLVQYTVEKDDTLQKISQKFYNSYGKWTRIYEANKSVITNPDRISPGTVIQIPVD